MSTPKNAKPIIFSTEMVQAILRGEKTQTRRKVKSKYPFEVDPNQVGEIWPFFDSFYSDDDKEARMTYKYKIGDILYVRETYCTKTILSLSRPYFAIYYKASAEKQKPVNENWKPSIFMPKEIARIFLKVTNIRVERLENISENDAIAEGVNDVESYLKLWAKINGSESLKTNPWVWVITFEKVMV